jgi:hypothetical protein
MRLPQRRWALGGAGILALAVAAAAVLLWFSNDELSRAELLAQGDEICASANDAFADLQREPPRTARQAAELTERLVEIAEDELDELEDLGRPAELADALDRYLAARAEGIELLREGQAAAEAGDSRRYSSVRAELVAGQPARRRLAREIGFRECSRPLRPRGSS